MSRLGELAAELSERVTQSKGCAGLTIDIIQALQRLTNCPKRPPPELIRSEAIKITQQNAAALDNLQALDLIELFDEYVDRAALWKESKDT